MVKVLGETCLITEKKKGSCKVTFHKKENPSEKKLEYIFGL
jgi:hypothetical protein